ncbi:MAG TPA: hypothetical protein VHI13_18545 [Candidatus Kapabacteria bacterium]|nr:hypothetical protein [Candidatus Kapabacteria bacterium]
MSKQKPQFTQGERIDHFAHKLFGNQRALAKAMAMQPSQVNVYCMNNQAPGYGPLKQLFELGMSIDWLMADENELYLFTMMRQRRGEHAPKRRIVEDMTTLELAEELARRLREEES